jgi:hypothetical protein
MRRFVLVSSLLAMGCPDEGPRGLAVTVNNARIGVNRSAPDALADLDVTLELVAQRQAASAAVDEVSITPLPDRDLEIDFAPRLLGPMGEVPRVSLRSGERLVVRVLNGSTTNGELSGLCGRPVELTVVMDDDGRRPEDMDTVTIACSG